VNLLDVAILAILVSAVAGGYRIGFVEGATAWFLLAQALVAVTLFLPTIDRALGRTNPGSALALEAFLFVVAGFAGCFAGRWMGRVFRRAFVPPEAAGHDRMAGAVGGPVAAVLLFWLLALPAMSQSPGFFARQAHRSLLARGVDAALPTPPDTTRAFSRLTGPAGMPEVFASLDPLLAEVDPPGTSGLTPQTVARVSASTVRVEGEACRLPRLGTGFTVAPEVVVTNAHVVAGQRQTSVVRPDGSRLAAVVTAYDPDRDLALLRVPHLGQRPLPLAEPDIRTTAAVFGHPEGQEDLQVSPALIRRQLFAKGLDLYADHTIRRDVLVLAATLRPGNSGSAVVNTDGSVVGVAFAISLVTRDQAFAVTTSELEKVLASNRGSPVSTGDCVF
jgi:S1-C subfamily serine protease